MGKFRYVQREEKDPFPCGTRLRSKRSGTFTTVLKECYCTGSILHYELLTDGDPPSRTWILSHGEIEDSFDVVGVSAP